MTYSFSLEGAEEELKKFFNEIGKTHLNLIKNNQTRK